MDPLSLLQKYNKEPFHLLHALTLEAVMRETEEEVRQKASQMA